MESGNLDGAVSPDRSRWRDRAAPVEGLVLLPVVQLGTVSLSAPTLAAEGAEDAESRGNRDSAERLRPVEPDQRHTNTSTRYGRSTTPLTKKEAFRPHLLLRRRTCQDSR